MSKFWAHDNPFDVYMTPLSNDNPVGEWVQFPTTAEKLRDVFLRLGIGPSQWAISEVADYVDCIRPVLADCQNLNELNYLAVKLDAMQEREVDQFRVVMELDEHCDSVAELINLCDNLDCYDFFENISDDEDLGRRWLFEETNLDKRTLREVEDFIDFEAYGQAVRENEGGVIADDCFVIPNGTTFHEYYRGEIGDIPEEAVVTKLINIPLLDEDERLERAIELAVDLDSFFRNYDAKYADKYPDIQPRQEAICDDLFDGRIAKYDRMLAELGQDERDVLPMELAEYKAGIRYDPEQDKEPETLTVLVVEPRKAPYMKELVIETDALENELGGSIEFTYPFDDAVCLIKSADNGITGTELNRALYGANGKPYDVIAGTFLIAAIDEGGFTDLSQDMIEKYSRRFQTIEVYAQVGNRLVMFQVPQDTLAALDDKTLDAIIQSKLEKKSSIHDKLAEAKKEAALKPSVPKAPGRSEHEL